MLSVYHGRFAAARPGPSWNCSGSVPPNCYLFAPIDSAFLDRVAVNLLARQSVVAVTLVTLAGCASIVSGRRAEIAVDSYPSNARVVIRDTAGREVAALKTPGVVSLRRNRRFFMPARYLATIEAPGYQPAQVPLRSTLNPWILGNVVVGGLPGLVVDTATGALWMPRRSQIHQQLAPVYDPQWPPYSPSAKGGSARSAAHGSSAAEI
jgi:hypothetical protein